MPELPEVEFARSVIERAALDRRIADVDDTDTYVCRPHRPGEIRDALVGSRLLAAQRRGKSMWCETDGGPALGLHLGMSGKIVVADTDGSEIDGGDYWEGRRQPGDYRWSRFSVTFTDSGRLMLVDPRRLGRITLDPDLDLLGPDAATVRPAEFRAAVTRGSTTIKARLLDQHAIAGIGNLLADEILWRARVHPAFPVDQLARDEVDQLLRATRGAVSSALKHGGVHTLGIIAFRAPGAQCPRDHAPMHRGKVGGRTSWWCAAEQRLPG